MGKPTGFLEYERRVSEEIAPLERIKNFNEFHIPLPLEKQIRTRSDPLSAGSAVQSSESYLFHLPKARF